MWLRSRWRALEDGSTRQEARRDGRTDSITTRQSQDVDAFDIYISVDTGIITGTHNAMLMRQ